ncbi:hypothetical protein F3D3_4600 [Fusibacter sp. 3D3]|nr:hypothetical protein F3D3_4600 [Fusibacter sp. 3D3]
MHHDNERPMTNVMAVETQVTFNEINAGVKSNDIAVPPYD